MKGQLFIVEGADCTGKSTLCRHLTNHLGGVYWHLTCTKPLAAAMYDYQLNAIENMRANLELGRNVVIDRHWPSEWVYGQIFRPGVTQAEAIRAALEPLLDELEARYIFCFSDDAVARHAREKDPSHPYEDDQYKAVYAGYEELYNQLNISLPSHRIIWYHLEEIGMKHQVFKGFLDGLRRLPN